MSARHYNAFPRRAVASARRARPPDIVAFADALKRGEGYAMYPYQIESIRCEHPRKCHRDGRDVGKTTEIELTHLYFALTTPRSSSLICAQWHNNLAPTMERLIALCAGHPAVAPRVRRVVRAPFYRIVFANGAAIWGKLAGNRGVNFQNTHVDLISVDEAQNLLDASWNELLPALNAGGRLHVYGVPNGLRNRYYQLCHDPGFAHFHWPSRLNPRFGTAKDEELQRFYGGADADGYVHNVLGEHGSPSSSAFDLARAERCVEARVEPHAVLRGDAAAGRLPEEIVAACAGGPVVLGVDVGYTRDPSVIVCWRVAGADTDTLTAVTLAIVELRQAAYAAQAALVAMLARACDAAAIACDRGGGGLALLQALADGAPELAVRIVRGKDGELGVPFNEAMAGGRRMKVATTDLYLRLIEQGRLRLGRSARLEQMARQTYRLTERGDVIYSKGDDHILDADRAVLYYLLRLQEGGVGRVWRAPRVDGI